MNLDAKRLKFAARFLLMHSGGVFAKSFDLDMPMADCKFIKATPSFEVVDNCVAGIVDARQAGFLRPKEKDAIKLLGAVARKSVKAIHDTLNIPEWADACCL